ncbi:hypothetical protein FB45DRAFT_1009087 [Roridomyces roridus]|uniref:Uncharacterized protein n=1 Tax=Roridomyces roridus TaxID=1738132 RepID=A0AAD7B7J6_9AGAR|nr:hypothetical protein FB45DRAFT_1009087 [Roridomyces roridus]
MSLTERGKSHLDIQTLAFWADGNLSHEAKFGLIPDCFYSLGMRGAGSGLVAEYLKPHLSKVKRRRWVTMQRHPFGAPFCGVPTSFLSTYPLFTTEVTFKAQNSDPGSLGTSPHPEASSGLRLDRTHRMHYDVRPGIQTQHQTNGPRMNTALISVRSHLACGLERDLKFLRHRNREEIKAGVQAAGLNLHARLMRRPQGNINMRTTHLARRFRLRKPEFQTVTSLASRLAARFTMRSFPAVFYSRCWKLAD